MTLQPIPWVYSLLRIWLNILKYQAMTDFVVYRGDTNLENADKSETGGDMIFHQFSRLRVVLSLDFIYFRHKISIYLWGKGNEII